MSDSIPVIDEPPIPTFAELVADPGLVAALVDRGIIKPTAVQAAAIPVSLTGLDLIVQAQTGSGKTLAFVLPMLMRLRALAAAGETTKRLTYGLIITPTRELATQVQQVIASVVTDIKPVVVIGGASIKNQVDDLYKDARIVVGTPGRIMDLIEQGELQLKKCREFVLDEADEMLSMGFVEEVTTILSRIPKPRQGMFFSATISPRVQQLAKRFLESPQTIVVNSSKESAPQIEHLFFRVSGGLTDKANALCTLLATKKPESAIIFCNTKSDTELVEVFLSRRGFDARRINSDLSQKERDTIMGDLRSGALKYLIATDVAARGIDIKQLDLVVNYAIHDQAETYLHRTGRTGRAGRSGTAISIVGPQDFGAFHSLKRTISVEIKEISPPA